MTLDRMKDLWNERFSQIQYVYGTEANVFLKTSEPRLKRKSVVLSIAEGEGRNAVFLAEKGHQVTAWDYSMKAIEKQKRLAHARAVEMKSELVDLELANMPEMAFDAIVCVFGHFPKELRQKVLEGSIHALKKGGWLIWEVYSTAQINYGTGGPKELDWLYKPEEILQFFSDASEWHMPHFFCGEVWREEGELHRGRSHVIQFAIQKK